MQKLMTNENNSINIRDRSGLGPTYCLTKGHLMTYKLGAWQKRCFFLLFLWLLSPMIVGAAPEVTQLRAEAHRTSQRIKIDGELSESDWQEVEPISRLCRLSRDEGQPISQPTEVRILYDNRNLYLGFTCFDTDISKLVANELRRDARLYDNDSVMCFWTHTTTAVAVFSSASTLWELWKTRVLPAAAIHGIGTGMRFGRAAPRLT